MKAVWPARMAAFYPYPKYLPWWKVAVAGAVLACVTLAAVYSAKRFKYVVVGWFWFLGTLIPVIGLIQAGAQSMADRYAYIPLIGIFIVTVWGGADLVERYKAARDYVIVASVAVVFVLIIVTRIQIGYWVDSTTLWTHAQDVTEDNYVAYNNLGEALVNDGKLGEAAPWFFRAIEVNPDLAISQENVGMILVQRGQTDEGIAHYYKAIQLDPGSFDTFNKLGAVLARQGQIQEAINCLNRALYINPTFVPALANLGILFENQGRLDEASSFFEKALQSATSPETGVQLHVMLGNVLAKKGDTTTAAQEYRAALRLNPAYTPALEGLNKIAEGGS
jgi:tetratricopeptide (TPR) repeat protein